MSNTVSNETWLHTATRKELKAWILNDVFMDRLFKQIFNNAAVNHTSIGEEVEKWLDAPHETRIKPGM